MDCISKILRKVRAVVLSRGAPPDDADDIVQEAFARLVSYTRAHEVRSQEAFLVTTAMNIARDQARRSRVSPFQAELLNVDLVADVAPQPDEVLRAQERLRRAGAGLEQLDPRARRILLAQRLEGLSYAEIAARENMTIFSVEKQIARSVLFLVKWMDGW